MPDIFVCIQAMVYNSSGMHEGGKMGFVHGPQFKMYENIIINVV